VRLIIAGDGPMRDGLEQDFARRGLSGAVAFLGFTREVPVVMAAADCVVLLSEAEGLPQVLVQAAAVGRPFVAYPVDGPRELLRKGATGSIVRDSREAAWATLAYFEAPAARCHVELSDWSPATVRSAYRGIFSSLSERLEGPR
jgi:glycosyltransferase involved in cell wall biosynthesis